MGCVLSGCHRIGGGLCVVVVCAGPGFAVDRGRDVHEHGHDDGEAAGGAAEGRLPHQEVMEGMVILLAGVVLLTPGFLTDAAGFLLLTPPVRECVVWWLKESLKNRVRLVVPRMGAMGTPDKAARPEPPGKVIDVEVVEE